MLGGDGGGLRAVPVSVTQLRLLKELKCGAVGMLPGHWLSAEHRLGEVRVNLERFRPCIAEGLVNLGAIYRGVTWNPTTRDYDVAYRLTPGTDISYLSGYIALRMSDPPGIIGG